MLKYSFRLSLGWLTIALVNASSSNTIVGTICVTKKSKVSGAKPAFNLAKCLTAETYFYLFFFFLATILKDILNKSLFCFFSYFKKVQA